MKKQRIAAIIACFILMAVTSLSLFYIEKELNHDCTGEDCAVCVCIHQAEAVLKNIGNGVSLSVHAINMMLFTVCLGISVCFILVFKISLISKKVRLND